MIYAGHNISEDYLYELTEYLKDKKFGVINISKSGTTTETALAFRLLKKQCEDQRGKETAKKVIVAVTDAKKGAARVTADKEGYKTFIIPDNVGGRFSVLTPVGLLPIAVAGFDIDKLVAGAADMEKVCGSDVAFAENPAAIYAAEASATATPEAGHSATYSQAADTDSIKGWPAGPSIEGQSAVLMDAVTDTVLYSKNPDDRLYPASITKIMTALLACENLDMNDTITMSQEAAYGIEAGSSTIYAETGEVFTVEQALMALMLESANEMALALAEKTSGSVKKFVELMNQRAAQLGCKNTHFNNPNGLPDETHYTTAGDMMKIAKAAWYNPRFRKFVTTQVYEIPPTNKQSETRYLLNHHKMMPGQSYAYDGVLGGKTGYTDAAGSTLVTYAKRGNSILIAVVLNSTNGAFPDTTSLLDYGFDNFEKVDLNIDTDPVPAVFLPCEKHLLKDWNNLCSFYYMRHVYVTVPTGTDVSQLVKKQKLLNNSVGPKRIKSKYYLDGHMVGYGMQYEKEILSDFLLNASF